MKKYYPYYTLFSLLCLLVQISFAQREKLFFERYDVAQGLPEDKIQDILQDDQGFIWFGTQSGLVKYDGYDFEVFRGKLDPADSSGAYLGLCNGGFIKSRDGKIWVGTDFNWISSYDPVIEKFRFYHLTPDGPKPDGKTLLFEDDLGNIWFLAWKRADNNFYFGHLNPETGQVKYYPDLAPGIKSKFGWFTSQGDIADPTHGLWLLDKEFNLRVFHSQKDSFELVLPAGQALAPAGLADTIRFISPGEEGSLILTSDLGVYVFDTKKEK